MTVRLTFVGSGDAFASGGRFQTCLHLEADDAEPLMIDCGATTLIALKHLGIDPATIGHIALTHLHGDHFGGLPWLILDGQFAKRTNPLEILGPAGTLERFETTFEALYPGATNAERPFETRINEFTERTQTSLGPARITAYPVKHTPGTMPHALRIEYAGKVITYSGDTEWTEALIEASQDADLFVCECNFFQIRAPGHLDYQTLAEHRAELGAHRIVLTHLSEEMLARLEDVELDTASDGAVFEV